MVWAATSSVVWAPHALRVHADIRRWVQLAVGALEASELVP